eukprot:GILJ01005415.1.p1 GENE.GILJ01005415.1~~GILJ01005415.1.p1  ORF type:complete len:318 (+),score=31.38 GILJ01005415.1:54-956(+)
MEAYRVYADAKAHGFLHAMLVSCGLTALLGLIVGSVVTRRSIYRYFEANVPVKQINQKLEHIKNDIKRSKAKIIVCQKRQGTLQMLIFLWCIGLLGLAFGYFKMPTVKTLISSLGPYIAVFPLTPIVLNLLKYLYRRSLQNTERVLEGQEKKLSETKSELKNTLGEEIVHYLQEESTPQKSGCGGQCADTISLLDNRLRLNAWLLAEIGAFTWCDVCSGAYRAQTGDADAVCQAQCGQKYWKLVGEKGAEYRDKMKALEQPPMTTPMKQPAVSTPSTAVRQRVATPASSRPMQTPVKKGN